MIGVYVYILAVDGMIISSATYNGYIHLKQTKSYMLQAHSIHVFDCMFATFRNVGC